MKLKYNYKEYLGSEKWKKLRKKAREKANGNCELCGGNANNVHHITYPKSLEQDCLDNLLVVCKNCHNKLHGIQNSKIQLLNVIRKRMGYKGECNYDLGLDMSKTHSQDNSIITKRNIEVLETFEDYLDVDYVSKHFDCWKGVCFWSKNVIEDTQMASDSNYNFSGWGTDDIIMWLIINKGKYRECDNGNTKTNPEL